MRPQDVVLGADTIVVVDETILGKPAMRTMRRACCGCFRGASIE